MLTKPVVFQLSANIINKVLGFFITAALFRIYQLEQIGEYFLILSYLGIFYSLQNFGASKALVDFNINNDSKNEAKVLKTRLLLSLLFFPLFFYLCFVTIDVLHYFIIIIIGFTLFTNSLSVDHVLFSKKKFFLLSIYQVCSQLLLFFFFAICYFNDFQPLIAFHQIIPSLIIFILIWITIINSNLIQILKIIKSKIIKLDFFIKNKVLIFSEILLPLVIAFDYFLANQFLNEEELGIISGLLRYSLLTYGFLTIINKVLFSYTSKNNNFNLFIISRDKIFFYYKFLSSIILIMFLYPYLKYVMALNEPLNFSLPAFLICLGSFLMPYFFLELNKIESNFKKIFFKSFVLFIILVFGTIYLITIFISKNFILTDGISLLSVIFVIKWIFLVIVIKYVRKKSGIR